MYSNANNLKSEIVWSVSANDSTVSITPGEWVLRANNTVACLEHYENEICTKREVIKITSISDNTLTITRSFAVCVMNDKTKEKGDTSFSFDEWDFLSMYLSKELRESLTDWVGDNQTAYETMLENLAVPRTCINNCLTTRQSAIDTAYRTKFWWVAWFWNGSDWDCVISEDTFLDAWREYNFRNLTICPDVLVRFEGAGVPTINVRDKFCNLWTIELKAPYVNSASILECWCSCWKEVCNKPTDWGACCGGAWWANGWCVWEPWTETSWWKWWGVIDWTEWWEPDWLNWWEWAYPTNRCNWYWWGWGGWWGWRYWNGWTGWRWWYCWVQTSWWKWWNGWNSWLYWTGWTGWRAWGAYSAWSSWYWWNWWNWYYWWYWWDGWNCWYAWNWWCWIIEGWHWWNACGDYAQPWCWWNAITNVYWFHLNARCIFNNCVNARGWNWGEWWNWSGSSCNYHFTCGCPWWNGADWGQMIVTYCKMIEEGCFDVNGWDGWLWGRTYACLWTDCPRPMRMQSWTGGANWRKVMCCINDPNVTPLMYTLWETKVMREDSKLLPSSWITRWKTIVVYSAEDFPESPDDWTLVVESTVFNQYKDTPITLTLEWWTYHFSFFVYDTENNLISITHQTLNIFSNIQYAIVWGGWGWGWGCHYNSRCWNWWGGWGGWQVICGIGSLWWIFKITIWCWGGWWCGELKTNWCNWWDTCFWAVIAHWWGWGWTCMQKWNDWWNGWGWGWHCAWWVTTWEWTNWWSWCDCSGWGGWGAAGSWGRNTFGGQWWVWRYFYFNTTNCCCCRIGWGWGGWSRYCCCQCWTNSYWWGTWAAFGNGGNASWYWWGWGGWAWLGAGTYCNWWNWCQWAILISYPCDCAYNITWANETFTCCWYTVHIVNADWKLCIW